MKKDEIESVEEVQMTLFERILFFIILFIKAVPNVLFSVYSKIKNDLSYTYEKRYEVLVSVIYICIILGSLYLDNIYVTLILTLMLGLLSLTGQVVYRKLLGLDLSKIIQTYACYLFCSVMLFVTQRSGVLTESELINTYTSYFMSGNYNECNELVYRTSDMLLPSNVDTLGTFIKSDTMYREILGVLRKNIMDISYNNQANTMTIEYHILGENEHLILDEEKVYDTKNKFLNNEISQDELKESLTEIYYDAFVKTVLTEKTAEITSTEGEIKIVQGKLSGVYNLLNEVLEESNLSTNLAVYEDEIQSTVNVILREETDI